MRTSFSGRASAALVALLAAAPARAYVLDVGFEDLDRGSSATAPVPAGYAGFGWQNLSYVANPPVQPAPRPSPIYGTIGNVSAETTGGAGVPSVISRSTRFTLLGLCLTPETEWWEQVDVEGWRGSVRVYTQTVDTVWSGPTAFTFSFTDVDVVRIVPHGGPVAVDELQLVVQDTIPPSIGLWWTAPMTDQAVAPVLGWATDAGAGIAVGTSGVARNGDVSVPLWIDAAGQFNGTIPLSEGPNAVLIQVTDRDGNVGSRVMNVVRDSSPPVVQIVTPPPGGVVSSADLTFTATVSDASDVSLLVEVLDASGLVVGSYPCWAWQGGVVIPIGRAAEGQYGLRVTATDRMGHQTHNTSGFYVDLSGPPLSVDVASGSRFGPLLGDLLPLHVTVSDHGATTLTTDFTGPIAIPAGGLTLELSAPLVEGTNEIVVQATDPLGRTSTTSITVIYDTTAPAVAFLSPRAGAIVRGSVEVALGGSDSSGVTAVSFSIDGGAAVAASGVGPWAAALDFDGLADGEHVVAAQAVDGVGNVATPAITVVVDQTPPTVALDAPEEGAYVRGAIAVTARASDPTSGVANIELRANGQVVASCAADRCAASIDTSAIGGPLVVSAVAVDRAGNSSQPVQRGFVPDNLAPSLSLAYPAPGVFVAGESWVWWRVDDPAFAYVECSAGDAPLGRSTEPSSFFVYQVLTVLDGPLPITCTAFDLAGNAASQTVVVTVRNWTLSLSPSTLHLKSSSSSTVTLKVKGQSADLLATEVTGGRVVALAVPGGFPVPLGSGPDDVAAGVDHGIPYATFKVSRAALVASIEGAMAAGPFTGPLPMSLPFELVTADGRHMGTVWQSVQ
jgi:hypothetical protein